MRTFLIIFGILISTVAFSQMKPGFDYKEANNTISLCNTFNFFEKFGSNKTIIPEHFNLIYSSEILGLDNKFEVYENDEVGIINFRGSTDKVLSWVENFYSVMIPAEGKINVDNKSFNYRFATRKNAAVHSGYALTIVILSEKIKEQIKMLNKMGIYDIIITGHSQGGALATMTRAYLENLPKDELSSKNKYKTYAYAQPMSGNKEFADEYNSRFSDNRTSFSIVNPIDPIPNLPFNYAEDKLVSKEKLKGWLFGEKEFEAKKFGQDVFIRLFERGIKGHIKGTNSLINRLISLKLGQVKMPKYVSDINYYPTGSLKEIPEFKYPKVEIDVTGFSEKKLKDYEQDTNGKWYKKESKFFQHKPYNYYVNVLKKWDSNAFNNLEKTYLVSDL